MKKTKLKKLTSDFWKEAESLGLTDDLRFMQTVEAYDYQIEMIEGLRKAITAEGYKIAVPAGRDAVKLISNPSVSDLNKAEILAQKLRIEIDSKIEKAIQAKPPSADLKL